MREVFAARARTARQRRGAQLAAGIARPLTQSSRSDSHEESIHAVPEQITMPFDPSLLRDSFELVLQRDQAFPHRFYELLFERWPQARSLFIRNSEGAQNAMLAQTLMAVLDHFGDDAWLDAKLVPLGMQHAQYGVTPEMYDWVGDALISAVAEVSAEDWTEAHQAAWKAAYVKIARIMCPVAATAVPVDLPE